MLIGQIYYPKGDRFFVIDSAREWQVKITDPRHPNATNAGKDAGSGRPQIEVEATDGERELSLSIDLLSFAKDLEAAFLDFCALRFAGALDEMEPADKLVERNEFLRAAAKDYPALIADLNRIFKRMHEAADDAYLTIGRRIEK